MPLTTKKTTERTKYQKLLQLAQEQVDALNADKFEEFDQIIAEKLVLVESLVDAGKIVKEDPAIASIVEQIQQCDTSAEQVLYTKVGLVVGELSSLQQSQHAQTAYSKSAIHKRMPVLSYYSNPPRFFDQKT